MSTKSQIARAHAAEGGAVVDPQGGAAGTGTDDRATRLATAEVAAMTEAETAR